MGQVGDAFHGGTSDAYVNCQAASSLPGSMALASASNSGSQNGHPFSNSASASGSTGTIKISASNSGSAAVTFPGAVANAGWNDQITITGGTGTGIWIVPIQVNGQMDAVGSGASGAFEVAAYQNYNVLQPYGNSLNSTAFSQFNALNVTHNGTIYSSWDFQMVAFGVTDYGPSDPASLQHLTVDRVIYFAVPFTFGTPFELGIYAEVGAGERAAGGSTIQNSTQLDFSHTITWDGKGVVIPTGGTSTTDFNIASASGFDYSRGVNSPVPEPSAGVALALGLGTLGLLKRRARRALHS